MASDKATETDGTLDNEGPSYASLTAGLLARKGEAMPAAAAFTTESAAQHIPAQKLAQESAQFGQTGARPVLEDDCGLTASSIEPPGTDFEETDMASELMEDEIEPLSESAESGSMEERSAFIEHALTDKTEQPLMAAGTLDGDLEDDDTSPASLTDLSSSEIEQRDAPVSPDNGFASRLVAATVDRASDLLGREGSAKVPTPDSTDKSKKSTCATTKAIAADRIKSAYTSAAAGGTALHLDPRRFIRLQVAAMKLEVDRKELLSAALDAYLDALDEEVFADCTCMRKGLI